ncbi:hypothetical protein PFISCL1PPCAC_28194, partial [Pristionchus fissidentatus]
TSQTSAVIFATFQAVICLFVSFLLGENILEAIMDKKEPANIDVVLLAFMVSLLVCALATMYGVVLRKTKPIIFSLMLMLIIFLICTVRLGSILFILGRAVQAKQPRDYLTRLCEATGVLGASWFFLLLSLTIYNRAREDIQ